MVTSHVYFELVAAVGLVQADVTGDELLAFVHQTMRTQVLASW